MPVGLPSSDGPDPEFPHFGVFEGTRVDPDPKILPNESFKWSMLLCQFLFIIRNAQFGITNRMIMPI